MESTGPTVICAWCRETMHQGSMLISHGICERCARRYLVHGDSGLLRWDQGNGQQARQ